MSLFFGSFFSSIFDDWKFLYSSQDGAVWHWKFSIVIAQQITK